MKRSGGNKLILAYQHLADSGGLHPDPAQQAALGQLQTLSGLLEGSPREISALRRLFSPRRQAPKGLYIFGNVGRGKTLVMDLFFAEVNIVDKRRVHFHEFMDEVHQNITNIRQSFAASEAKSAKSKQVFDPISEVVEPIIKQTRLLCFDEFHVNDITNAMLLGRLFERFFDAGMVVVATSNVAPSGLYKNGLNRELFLPFIDLLKSRCDVVHLEGTRDYRAEKLSSRPVFYFGRPEKVRGQMDRLWRHLLDGLAGQPGAVHLLGRSIKVPATLMGMARFEFADLCENPLGARDFLAIVHNFHTLVIDDIPRFGRANSDAAKRFILLLDTLYNQGGRLAASFACPLDELSTDPDTAFEFRRCVSRLKEMASDTYLSAAKARHPASG